MTRTLLMILLIAMMGSPSALAGTKSKAVSEAAEYVLKHFGKEAAEETVETLTVKIGKYSAKYGDDAIMAIRKAGPRGFKLLDDAGEHAPEVARLLSRYGNDAVWVASKPKNLAIFVKHGDEAAEAMIKHPGIAEPAIESFGRPAAQALQKVSPQNARRVAMMAEDGSLTAAGKADGLLKVVAKYGDNGANFIWKNKGALAVATVAAAFIANPQPFIDGSKDLAEVAIRPLDSAAKEMGRGAAAGANWTVVLVTVASLAAALVALLFWRPWKRRWNREPEGPRSVESSVS